MTRLVGGVLFCAGVGLAGCAAEPRVMVVALDGADPDVVDLLMSEGKLPNLARMRQGGAYGRLRSSPPLLSPVVWTTIATGVPPEVHGIGHFSAYDAATGERVPVTSGMRRVRAIWNIASSAGKRVAVIGWWATWPPEEVNGAIVSDHVGYHFLFEHPPDRDRGQVVAKTHPPDLMARIEGLMVRPGDLTRADVAGFVDVTGEQLDRPFSFHDDLGHFKWALATSRSYASIGREIWDRDRPHLMLLYMEGLDTVSHLYGHLFRARGLSGEIEEQRARYGMAVERMYEDVDRLLGDIIDTMDAGTTIVVLSDHGFRLGELHEDPSHTRDMRRVSEAFHEPEGVLYAFGHGVAPRSRFDAPTILDIAPTLLALLAIPAGGDMPGRALTEGFRGLAPPPRIATWEKPGTDANAPARDPRIEPEMMEKLESLGYVGAQSPAGDRNLAGILFESGRYAESEQAYRKLIEKSPDEGSLHASLAGVLGAQGRLDEAMEHLDRAIALDPLNAEAWHNRAVVSERRGLKDAAASDYREALRYNPGYAPSRRALERLGVPVQPPHTSPGDAAARPLAEEASLAARRGDYAAAKRLLDEAERIAPDSVLVQHYRSNVAHIMGDRDGAIEALRKGLALEPDNALFRENLRRLQSSSPPE